MDPKIISSLSLRGGMGMIYLIEKVSMAFTCPG